MHIEKFSVASMGQMLAHVERKRDAGHYGNKNIDSTKTQDNFTFSKTSRLVDGKSVLIPLAGAKKTLDYWAGLQKKTTGRALRKDAVALASIVVTLPDEYKDATKDEQMRFFKSVWEFLKMRFQVTGYIGQGRRMSNLVYTAVHFDETTPHLHFGFVPVAFDMNSETNKVEKVHISFKRAVNRSVYASLHREVDKYLRKNLQGYRGGILLSDEKRVEKYAVYNQWQALEVRDAIKELGVKARKEATSIRSGARAEADRILSTAHADAEAEKAEASEVAEYAGKLLSALESNVALGVIGRLYQGVLNLAGPDRCFNRKYLTPEENALLNDACDYLHIEKPKERELRLEMSREL